MSRPLWPELPLSLAALGAELQSVFGSSLASYCERLRPLRTPRKAKIINDPIWRTIRIEPWEITVLDSPILQRLRHVHQLGLASLVYPAAGYSRFEHTLGALYQTQSVVESINRNAQTQRVGVQADEPIPRKDEVLLRMAALLHDVGHCFLSHVSERSMVRLEIEPNVSVRSMLHDAKTHFRCHEAPSIGEVLSASVILLPEFIDVLRLAAVPLWVESEDTLAFSVARLIVGGRFPDRPFLNEIISGALDCDKLDYMPRDCYMAGLAMPIDVERILEKLNVVRVPASTLGEHKTESNLNPEQTIEVLALQHGAAQAFEDLVVSRVLLYSKLYHHHKIRAAEGAIVNALDVLRQSHPDFRHFSTYLRLSDAEFLQGLWPDTALGTTNGQIDTARKIVDGVRRRDTFVRAFAFGPERIADSIDAKIRGRLWRQLARLLENPAQELVDFRTAVRGRAQLYLRTIGQPTLADELTEAYIAIDLPDVQGIAKRTRFFVGDESFGVKLYNEMFRVDKWAEAYENQKMTGYVYCPREYALAVHLAFRDVVQERFKLNFEPWSWRLAKIQPGDLEKLADGLRNRGIELQPAPVPTELVARSEYLSSRAAKTNLLGPYMVMLEELGDRFRTFQVDSGEEVTKSRIVDWLHQFDQDEIPLMLQILQHIRYWDRPAIVDAFAVAVENDSTLHEAQWVPLGGLETSSHHLLYLWRDLRQATGYVPQKICGGAEEIRSGSPVVFYDDNVGSATQSRTVLQQWFGRPREEWYVDEEHVQRLSDQQIAVLRNSPIKFLFATGRRKGLANLVEATKKLVEHDRVEGVIGVVDDIFCFRPSAGVFPDKEGSTKAREALLQAGQKAVADKCGTWGAEKTESRLLGYGNDTGLNVFYYNVPTSTLTALWKSCNIAESSWMALFPRRPR